jgi:ankyrin repeat protein
VIDRQGETSFRLTINLMANSEGTTPLIAATLAKHVKVCELLLRYGADVNACRKDGATALYFAAECGDVAMVKLFLRAGAKEDVSPALPVDIVRSGPRITLPMKSTVVPPALIGTPGFAPSRTIVTVPASAFPAVQGVSQPVKSSSSGTLSPLIAAVTNGHEDVVSLLLRAGMSLDAQRHGDGHTAMHVAAARGRGTLVRLMLLRGAKADTQALGGETPLHLAAMGGCAARRHEGKQPWF